MKEILHDAALKHYELLHCQKNSISIETQNVNKVYLCIWKFSDSVVNVLHTLLKTNITKQDMDKSEYNAIQFEGYYQA